MSFTAFPQVPPGILDGKPGSLSVGFLWVAEPYHFAEVSVDGQLFLGCSCSGFQTSLAAAISGKRSFFHSAVNSGFLKGFQGRRLGVGHTALGVAFGEGPAPAAASSNQQELDFTPAHAVANCRHLFAVA
jgi:hypothetical protein